MYYWIMHSGSTAGDEAPYVSKALAVPGKPGMTMAMARVRFRELLMADYGFSEESLKNPDNADMIDPICNQIQGAWVIEAKLLNQIEAAQQDCRSTSDGVNHFIKELCKHAAVQHMGEEVR